MAMKVQGGRMVPVGGSNKPARDRQLNKLMTELSKARERVFQESQRLPDFDISGPEWNAHLTAMREFYAGVDAVKRSVSTLLVKQ